MDKETVVRNVQDKLKIENILKDIPSIKGSPSKLMAYFEEIQKKKYSSEFMVELFKEIEKKGHLNNINKTTWQPIYEIFKAQCPIIEDILKKE